jgi:hypothetical protein
VAASSARPPGESDVIHIVSTSGTGTPRVLDSLRVEGAVRALAGRMGGKATRLAAAVEGPDRATRLVVMDLARQRP